MKVSIEPVSRQQVPSYVIPFPFFAPIFYYCFKNVLRWHSALCARQHYLQPVRFWSFLKCRKRTTSEIRFEIYFYLIGCVAPCLWQMFSYWIHHIHRALRLSQRCGIRFRLKIARHRDCWMRIASSSCRNKQGWLIDGWKSTRQSALLGDSFLYAVWMWSFCALRLKSKPLKYLKWPHSRCDLPLLIAQNGCNKLLRLAAQQFPHNLLNEIETKKVNGITRHQQTIEKSWNWMNSARVYFNRFKLFPWLNLCSS